VRWRNPHADQLPVGTEAVLDATDESYAVLSIEGEKDRSLAAGRGSRNSFDPVGVRPLDLRVIRRREGVRRLAQGSEPDLAIDVQIADCDTPNHSPIIRDRATLRDPDQSDLEQDWISASRVEPLRWLHEDDDVPAVGRTV
jgi:hypothetical protein